MAERKTDFILKNVLVGIKHSFGEIDSTDKKTGAKSTTPYDNIILYFKDYANGDNTKGTVWNLSKIEYSGSADKGTLRPNVVDSGIVKISTWDFEAVTGYKPKKFFDEFTEKWKGKVASISYTEDAFGAKVVSGIIFTDEDHELIYERRKNAEKAKRTSLYSWDDEDDADEDDIDYDFVDTVSGEVKAQRIDKVDVDV